MEGELKNTLVCLGHERDACDKATRRKTSSFIVIVGDNERKFSNWFFLHTLLKVSAFLCISSVILLMGNTTFRYSLNPYSLYLAIGMLAPGLMLLLFVLLFMYFHEKIDDRKGYCVLSASFISCLGL